MNTLGVKNTAGTISFKIYTTYELIPQQHWKDIISIPSFRFRDIDFNPILKAKKLF